MQLRFVPVIVTLLFLTSAQKVQSQNCLENLYTASKLLDGGNTDGCLSYAVPCSYKSNDESVRWQAYRLMSIAYLLKGNTDSARVAAENMLDINPTYKPNLLKDPKEFISLLNRIVVIPKFTLGLAFSAGANFTSASISKSYVLSDYLKTYRSLGGRQFGTEIGFSLNPNLLITLGILATQKRYGITYEFTNWKVEISEKLTYLDGLLTAKYIFLPKNRLRPFVQGGFLGGYLLYDQNDFTSTYTPTEQSFKLTKLNAIDRRNRPNIGICGGAGAYYKINQGHISLTINYFHSFSQINDPEKRYNYPEQIYTYFYVDDDIILHNMAVSLGYTYYLNYKVYRSKK
jgi:hypothetical protein